MNSNAAATGPVEARRIVERIEAELGASVDYTEYVDAEHDDWNPGVGGAEEPPD